MTDFSQAIKDKMAELMERRGSLQDEIEAIDAKVELLRELIQDEGGEVLVAAAEKNKGGRPRGSKNKRTLEREKVAEASKHAVEDELSKEAASMPGTDPELAEKIRNRGKDFSPRIAEQHSNIIVSGKKGNPREDLSSSSHHRVEIGDNE